MVTRKSVATAQNAPEKSPTALPYPMSPSSPQRGQNYLEATMNEAPNDDPWGERKEPQLQTRPKVPNLPSMSDISDGWVETGVQGHEYNSKLPTTSLRGQETEPDALHSRNSPDIPALLRAGPPEGTPRTSSESQRSRESFSNEVQHQPTTAQPTNPYHRARSLERRTPDVSKSQEESSVDIWADLSKIPPVPTSAPPPPPVQPPLDPFKDLSISKESHYDRQTTGPWADANASIHHEQSYTPMTAEQYRAEIATQASPFAEDASLQEDPYVDHAGWSDQAGHSPLNVQRVNSNPFELDSLSPQLQKPLPNTQNSASKDLPDLPQRHTEVLPPDLPPRRSHEEEAPPIQPPRPDPTQRSFATSQDGPPRSDADTEQSRATKQRSETYQIKHVRWLDSSSGGTRISPIMVQNANGPCPLLALVNALTLSTSANTSTALVETLRVREQVSLGLLLDAVFDELMSGRRGDAAQELPDVADLYSFLVTLHTGMNVNPRFVNPQQPNLIDGLSPVYENRRPGGFEETKEMNLYSTFSVPLIHGWLPPQSHPAYAALQRSAKTYEDAQNLMFREEELEDKLQHHGLSHEEQVLLEDIASIKYFLSSSATQLTGYGLDTITKALLPGSIAILFRNDHFSTLYKHPRSGQLLTLVTDMGYAGHEEVVWESLVDINGEGSTFFAGDFRPVGTTPSAPPPTNSESGWTTVSHSRQRPPNNARPSNGTTHTSNPQRLPTPPSEPYNILPSPTTEQEDHDLALALQLQEEEDERSRSSLARRREEASLSRAYLDSESPPAPLRRTGPNSSRSQQSQIVRPLVPPRGGSVAANATRRPPPQRETVRPDSEAGDDAPPPSYEQAAKTKPYLPPGGQPGYGSPTIGAPGGRARGQSAYSQHAGVGTGPSVHRVNSAGPVGGLDGTMPRRRSVAYLDEDSRQRDCVVM